MKRQYAFLTGIVLALLVFSGVYAQDATPAATPDGTSEATPEATAAATTELSYGQPVTGAIDDSNFKQDWPLTVASADRVEVQVKRTSGNLVPGVQILDGSGQQVAQSYGADKTFAAAQIDDTALAAAGTYTIEVSRDGADSGTTKGGYSLVVTPLGTGADNPNNTTVIGEVKNDTPINGEITATHWLQMYTYTAQGADTLDISVKRTGGTLDPVVYVIDSNGQTLETGYNSDSTADTSNFDLPAAGTYTVEVSRYNDQKGDTLGTYALTVHLIGAGKDNPTLQAAAGKVVYDQELDGKITSDQWYQNWQLTATAGDTITVTVNRKDGDLIPEVILLGGAQQNLREGDEDTTYANAEIDSYTLTGPGTFTVQVTRKGGQKGTSSGAYALTVALDATGADSATLKQPVGDLKLGTASQGEITNAQWQNAWTFTSDKGGSIDINVTRTDGTLVPNIQILDSNGQQMTSAYSSDSHDSAQISGYTLPGPGKFQIVVLRDSGQDGQTTGKYGVTVSATPAS